jgi:glycosyltransferase involved in cell wall biosynthesis
MKLAVVSNVGGYRWAGSEELWHSLAELNLERGGSLVAVVHRDISVSSQCDALRRKGARVIAWRPFPIRRLEKLKQNISPSFTRATLGQPDVMLVSCGSLPALCNVPGLVPFLSQTDIPFVILCQFNAESLPITAVERAAVRGALIRAKRTIFVSELNLALAQRQFACDLAGSLVIPNPIRVGLESPLAMPNTGEFVRMASVARLEVIWKGQDVLLETLADAKWGKRAWQLSLYGEGPDAEYLRDCARFYGLQDGVFFEGYERDVTKIWSRHHIKILPSRGEGMSLAMLEAMMCGRPVVATSVGGVAECIEEGKAGFLAPAATTQCLDAALERAWNRRPLWPEIGVAANHRAKLIATRNPAEDLLDCLSDAMA